MNGGEQWLKTRKLKSSADQDAVKNNKVISSEDLKKEIKTW
jgi:hypothetical protein